MKKNLVRIGTSGFSYKDWLGNFYPQFCSQADFLRFYSSKFNTVEIDSTYYRIPKVETVQKWAKSTPADFIFTAKFPSFVTHEGELESRIKNALYFVETMANLKKKLGVLLLQFPYSFKPEQKDTLIEIIKHLPSKYRYSVELRNKNWLDEDDIFDLFKSKNIAFCLIDHPWMPKVNIQTADFSYIRFLGDRKKIENDFSYIRFGREDELNYWKDIIIELQNQNNECFGYFNNHYSGHAPTTAMSLIDLLA